VRWQPKEKLLLALKGGPQLNTAGCKAQQGFSYAASITTKTLNQSQFFFTADRIPVAGNLGAGLWQDDVTAGFERRILRKNVITIDGGYVHSSTLVNNSTYRGAFFDSSFVRTLKRGLTLACSFRTFSGNSGGIDINRNILFVSLTLSPNTSSHPQ
jgi:hypothetical protein